MKHGTMPSAVALLAVCAVVAGSTPGAKAGQEDMTFFVTSVGKGSGADLGGLEGADAHCQALAKAAGSPHVNWRAYLSTTAPGGEAGVNARDRIGNGPWLNVKGVVVAKSVDDLHADGNNVTKQTALTEKGDPIRGRGDAVNTHDILTGSDPAGNYSTAGGDSTCGNWTKSGDGSAIVGHHDRVGLKDTRHMRSWNSSHARSAAARRSWQRPEAPASFTASSPTDDATPRLFADGGTDRGASTPRDHAGTRRERGPALPVAGKVGEAAQRRAETRRTTKVMPRGPGGRRRKSQGGQSGRRPILPA